MTPSPKDACALEEIFEKLCDYLDGKLKWSEARKKFTDAVLSFFSNLANQKENMIGERNYLTIDYVWRYETNSHHLELAVEHENRCKIDEFLTKEIQHLIDVKADNKIAITYPTLGEESNLIEGIRDKIKNCSRRLSTSENYLIVFGFSTSKRKFERGAKRRAIAFKAYYIEQGGRISKTDEKVVFQGLRTVTLRVRAIDEKGRPLRIPFRIERMRKQKAEGERVE